MGRLLNLCHLISEVTDLNNGMAQEEKQEALGEKCFSGENRGERLPKKVFPLMIYCKDNLNVSYFQMQML